MSQSEFLADIAERTATPRRVSLQYRVDRSGVGRVAAYAGAVVLSVAVWYLVLLVIWALI